MATYNELQQRINELKSRTGKASISPRETFELMDELLAKTKGVDMTAQPLVVVKSYDTLLLANADKNPINPATNKPLTLGQLASVTADGDNNAVYRLASIGADGTPVWEKQAALGDMKAYARSGGSERSLRDVDIVKSDIGNIFSISEMATRGDGSISPSIKGINCSDFIPIAKNATVNGRGWTGSTGGNMAAAAFYDTDKKFIEAVGVGDGGYVDYSYTDKSLPKGAAYVRGTENALRGEGYLTVSVLSLIDDLDKNINNLRTSKIGADDLNNAVDPLSYLMLKEGRALVPESITPGKFVLNDGGVRDNAAMSIVRYSYDYSKIYSCTLKYSTGIGGINAFHFYDANDQRIGSQAAVNDGLVKDYYGIINPNAGTSYFIMNQQNSAKADVFATSEYYRAAELSGRIEVVAGQVGGYKSNKVIFLANGFYARTKYDMHNDLIIKYRYDANGQITPDKTYKGSNALPDEQLLNSVPIHDTYDSTAPVWMPEYWYLGAQHGYEMCLINATHDKDNGDVGSKWKDNLNREFTLVKVDGNSLYFNPIITIGTPEGKDLRSWKTPYDSDAIEEMTHVNGAMNTAPVTQITSKPRYSYKPIQKPVNRKFIADGKLITDFAKPVYCDEFTATETLQLVNPIKVTQWFPDLIHEPEDWEMFNIVQSFNISGLSTTVNTILNVKYPLDFTHYGANQARTLIPVAGYAGYDSYAIIPKTKPAQFASKLTDFRNEFNSSAWNSNDSIAFYRAVGSVEDINNLPDRIVSYLRNDTGNYAIGFASGMSLTRGITIPKRRNALIPAGTGRYNQALYFSPSNGNKFYIRAIEGDAFPNRLLPRGIYEVNYYLSYFNPSLQKNKVHWYKDGGSYVVYVHSDEQQSFAEILLPEDMEGLSVEVIEKTDGAAIHTEVVQNNKMYASFANAANYLVIKIR